jgi:hypothetical protein
MANLFPGSKPIPGVTDNGDTTTRAVPVLVMKTARPSASPTNAP